jgi:hypothetical protein
LFLGFGATPSHAVLNFSSVSGPDLIRELTTNAQILDYSLVYFADRETARVLSKYLQE